MIHALRYCLRQAVRSMRAGLLVQLASTGSITVALLLVGMMVLGAANLEQLTAHLDRGLRITAYVRDGAPDEQVATLRALLQKHPVVASARLVSSEEAYERLTETLGNRRGLLEGLERSFLPASLELSLAEAEPARVRPLLALLSASPVVEEVDQMGHWVKRLSAVFSLAQAVGLAIAVIVCLVCLYIIGSTIRLGVFARRDEIQILKLVGATDRYVRAPFLMEGALQGLFGALLAWGLLFFLYWIGSPEVEGLLSSAVGPAQIAFLSPPQLLVGVGGGVLLGLAGSRIALGRYVDV
jgi:cell division transport system permease protein